MAIFRLLNEFGREPVCLALEPARQCIAHCTYCFAALNSRAQSKGKRKSHEDSGTFESTVEKAFSSAYDPSNFLQWAVHNRMPVGFANTVEPFQDIPQAQNILRIAQKIDLPLFVQTKGVNIDAVWDDLVPLADNAVLFVSFPTPDDRVIKRFEPGTPLSAARIRLIERAADAGFHVILALAPYHEEWCDDPYGFVESAAAWGVDEVFFDHLHLNKRQREVATDPAIVTLAYPGEYSEKRVNHLIAIYAACVDNDLEFSTLRSHPITHGVFPSVPSICPPGIFARGYEWPYHDGFLFSELESLYPEDDIGPVIVTWQAVLDSMEMNGDPIDQPISMSSMRDLMAVKELSPAWLHILGDAAPLREYFRAIWNHPSKTQFGWRHPFMRIAMRPDGTPWIDGQGNAVAVYAPDTEPSVCVLESLDAFHHLAFEAGDQTEVLTPEGE